MVEACLPNPYDDGLVDDDSIVDTVPVVNKFGSAQDYCPRGAMSVPDDNITFTVELRPCKADLQLWYLLLSLLFRDKTCFSSWNFE